MPGSSERLVNDSECTTDPFSSGYFRLARCTSPERSDAIGERHVLPLMQLGVLGSGFLQDWNVGVGIFPKRQKFFITRKRPDACGVCIGSLRDSRLQGLRAGQLQSR